MNKPLMQLDYRALRPPKPLRLGSLLPPGLLMFSAIGYLLLCRIAVQRTTSYIPYTYWPLIREIWIVPIILLAVWVRTDWKTCFTLFFYSFATAVVRANSVIAPATAQNWMVPYSPVGPGEALINLVVYAPLHLMEAAVIFLFFSFLLKPLSRMQPRHQVFLRTGISLFVSTAACFSPRLYHRWMFAPAEMAGIARANADWAAGTATLLNLDGYDSWNFGGVNFDSVFDHNLGLRSNAMKGSTDLEAFEQDEYDRHVRRLYNANGRPGWAIQFLPDSVVASNLSTSGLKQVTAFPYKVNTAVTLKNANTLEGNHDTGYTYGSGSPPLPVFVGDDPSDPLVQFVRFGTEPRVGLYAIWSY